MSPSTEPVGLTELDPAVALMQEVGAQLRKVRKERGEDLSTVADTLRIKTIYLDGIEQGDLSVMPGRAYALGFLRSYADYLGFDGDDLIEQIRSIVEDLTDRTRLEMRTPLRESRVPKAPVIALSIAMLAGVYVGWAFLQGDEESPDELVAEVPENLDSIAVGALPEPRPVEPAEVPPPAAEDRPTAPGEPAGAESEPARLSVADGLEVATTDPSPAAAASATDPQTTSETFSADAESETATLEQPAPAAPLTDSGEDPGRSGRTRPDAPEPDRALADVLPQAGPEPAAGPIEPAAVAPLAAPEQTSPPEPAPSETIPETQVAEPRLPAPETTPAQAGLGPTEGSIEPSDDIEQPPEVVQVETQPGVAFAAAAPATAAEVVAEIRSAPGGVAEVAARSPDAGPPVVMEEINQDARVVLHALEISWIRIASESGDYLRSRTLEPGDVFLVPNRDDLELWTGNAGGLEVIVDGERVPPLGDAGTVVRDVSLAPPALRSPEGTAGG